MTATPQNLWGMTGIKSKKATHDEYYLPLAQVPQNVKDYLKGMFQAEPADGLHCASQVQEGGQEIHLWIKKWEGGQLGLYWCDADVWKTKEQEKAARQAQQQSGGRGGRGKDGYWKEKNPKFAITEQEQIQLMEQGWKLKEKDVHVVTSNGLEVRNLYVQYEYVRFDQQNQQQQQGPPGAQQ